MTLFLVKKILLGNKLRSSIPLIGIIIGVASIMGIFAISSGGEAAVKKDLASIATNRVMIASSDGYEIEDLKLVESLPIVKYAFSPDIDKLVEIDNQTSTSKKIKIVGYTPKAIQNKELEVTGKKYLHGKNVLISEKVANEIFSSKDIVGQEFWIVVDGINRIKLRVVGVYKESLDESFGVSSIYMDLDEFKNIDNSQNINNLVVAYNDDESVKEATNYVIQMLSRKNYSNKYTVIDGNSRYKKIEKIKNMINTFLSAVGIVALIMGGLGVSNLLMNTVREMTPSIGILRTMGMSANNVLKLFLVEATILSTLGGFIGIILGCLGAYLVGKVIGIPSIFYPTQIIMVFTTSVGMGIIFGSLPAWKAAKMEVVEALKI